MAEWWAQQWQNVLAVAGVLIGLIGIYLGIKGWKRKRLRYLIRSTNIFTGIDHMVPNVEVKFPGYGPMIKALTVTKIVFWNSGSDTIKSGDIVTGDPLIVRATTGIVFLSAAVTDCFNPLNKVECIQSKDRTEVAITFEYLDQNQGAMIQIFHTGAGNADIRLNGTVMGASPMKRVELTDAMAKNQKHRPLWIPSVALGVGWGGWLLHAVGLIRPEPGAQVFPVGAFGIGLLLGTFLFVLIMWLTHIPKPFSKIRD
jgi:hypothetical protein